MTVPSVFPFFAPQVGRVARGSLVKAVPRVAPAAVRVPTPVQQHAQLAIAFPQRSPQIFVHEGARRMLERRLRGAYPGPIALAVTDNRHSMVSFAKRGGVLEARVHMMFLDAPPVVQEALVKYIVRNDREASQLVGRFIDANGHRIRASRAVTHLATKGEHHDLLALSREVNDAYFGGSAEALITWGKQAKRRERQTIKLGSYSAIERLVRIHRNLDRRWVPRYFVKFIIYHELLHHVMPASRGAGRNMLHPPEFRARERQFHQYERAVAWEQGHIGRLLRI